MTKLEDLLHQAEDWIDPRGATSRWVSSTMIRPLVAIVKRQKEALDLVDMTLTIPAAEYVPAIGDAMKLIDEVRLDVEQLAKGTP